MFSKTPLSRRLTELEQTKKIAILTRTPLWKACLQRNFHQTEISWALDIDTLVEEVAGQELLTVIIELVPAAIVEDCRKVLLTSQALPANPFFCGWRQKAAALVASDPRLRVR